MVEKYVKVSEIARKWGISSHRVQVLCKEGRIEGVKRFGKAYLVPISAIKPTDKRKKLDDAHCDGRRIVLPKSTPFLTMTDLYSRVGALEESVRALSYNQDAQTLFLAEIAYSRGEIEEATSLAQKFLKTCAGVYESNAVGMILALCAMWKGDVALFKRAKQYIIDAQSTNQVEEEIKELSIACINSAVKDLSSYPEWFKKGNFENLHKDSHSACKIFYVKHLVVMAQEIAKGNAKIEGVTGLGLMKTIPYIVEPMIVDLNKANEVIAETYLRLMVAISYHQTGDDESAITHIDKAVSLALPDGLLGILAEHRRDLDLLLDERLELIDKNAYSKYKKLHKTLLEGWTKLHNALFSKTVSVSFTIRERQVARYASFGLSNAQIAERLNISLSATKKAIYDAMNKAGVYKREDLGNFV